MKSQDADRCSRELDVVRAVRTAESSAELDAHVLLCARCSDTRALAVSMALIARAAQRESHRLPDARVIWMRAQFLQQQSRARLRETVRYAGVAIALVCVAVLAVTRIDRTRSTFVQTLALIVDADFSHMTIAIIIAGAVLAWSLTDGIGTRRTPYRD